MGGKFLEKKEFKKVLKKIEEIRRIIRIEIPQIIIIKTNNYPINFYVILKRSKKNSD